MKSLKEFLTQQFGDRLISISEAVDGEKKYRLYLERQEQSKSRAEYLKSFKNYIAWFNGIMGKTGYDNEKSEMKKKVLNKYVARRKEGIEYLEISNALGAIRRDKYHVENNFQYVTPEYLLRSEVLEKYKSMHVPKKETDKPKGEILTTESGLKYRLDEKGNKIQVK